MFRILGSVDALNKKMGVNLTRHDVNWIYNRQHLKGQGYYLKTRVPVVRLILCLPDTNKGMDKDFVIVSKEWHDELHCPTQDGTLGGVFRFRFTTLTIPLTNNFCVFFFYFVCKMVLFFLVLCSNNIFLFGEFVDKYSAIHKFFFLDSIIPNFSLVNEPYLKRILKAEIFVHIGGQL